MFALDNQTVYQQSDWKELVHSYCLAEGDFLVFWKAYIDESGTHATAPFAVVGTALAETSVWDCIIPNWQRVLAEFGVTRFHASEVNGCYGEYAGWSDERKDSFVRQLIDIISKHRVIFGTYSVETAMYHQEAHDLKASEISVYDYLLCHVVIAAGIFCLSKNLHREENDEPHEISIFVGAGCDLSTTLFSILSKLAARGIYDPPVRRVAFENEQIVPLQVADLISYDVYKHCILNPHDIENIKRKSLKRLDEENSMTGKIITRDWLRYELPDMVKMYEEKRAIEKLKP
jgi:hypothetical protein